LITPASVAPGAYTLSELRMARDKWPNAAGHVLPVLLQPTEMTSVPAYLRSVTFFEPQGNAAAELAAHLAKRRRVPRLALAAIAVAVVAAAGFAGVRLIGDRTETWKVKPEDFVTRYVYPAEVIENPEYSLDPTFPAKGDWSRGVRVNRIAFGTIMGKGAAMSVDLAFTNAAAEAIRLDLTSRFFELQDDQGRKSELLYFCCRAAGEILGPGQERQIRLLFAAQPGWSGKATNARKIDFHVNGLLPLARGTWVVPTLATAE
jgi:hypothetical protein